MTTESFPMSDPTPLTTAQILREINSLEKLMDAIEKAVTVAHENLVRVPTEVDKAIGHLRELMLEKFLTIVKTFETTDQKFHNIQTQFMERDARSEQAENYTKTAVDAAFAA